MVKAQEKTKKKRSGLIKEEVDQEVQKQRKKESRKSFQTKGTQNDES